MASNGITARLSFYRIWIAGKKLLVKRAPGRRQAIIWNNVGILFIGPLGTNFSEIVIEIYIYLKNPFENVVRKLAAILYWPQCVNTFN